MLYPYPNLLHRLAGGAKAPGHHGPIRRRRGIRSLGAARVAACLALILVAASCDGTDISEPRGPFATAQGSSPNILLIIADDMGLEATPGYALGTNLPAMPTLQSLQSQGITFDNFWADPTCAPTRASLLTGRYGFRNGVIVGAGTASELPPGERSLHQYLADRVDYRTAVIGKWHLGGDSNGGADHPNLMGVGDYAGELAARVASYDRWDLTVNGVTSISTDYATTKCADLAIDWIDGGFDGLAGSEPWFLWLAFNAPHPPFHSPPGYTGSTDDVSQYLAMLEAMDHEMGRVIAAAGLANTVVIFLSDNGSPAGVVQPPFTAGRAKGTVYHGGVNTALVVAGAGVTRPGQREDALVNAVDLFATIAELTGAGITAIHDSQSLAGLLDGSRPGAREFAYAQIGEGRSDAAWAMWDGRHKLIRYEDRAELYDLETDPYEVDNLFDSGVDAEASAALSRINGAVARLRGWPRAESGNGIALPRAH